MRSYYGVLFVALLYAGSAQAQLSDTIMHEPVEIKAYFSNSVLLRSPGSVAVVDSAQLSNHHQQSLLPAMNTVPGVRMEERSPGSYRLSLRGSLLRSPFGVRNVKIYLEDFPLTDAGGNTYINLIDPSVVQRIEVMKGPDGSLFGANSGGVVRIGISDNNMPALAAGVTTGSYALVRANVMSQIAIRKHRIGLANGWHFSQGYRAHSAMVRRYFHVTDEWNYAEGFALRALLFTSDLDYETPGGLTLQQFRDNPRQARPATATLPGAEKQNAHVENSTLYGGLQNESKINAFLTHSIAVFGSKTDFVNPFITNYEQRRERTGGIRTWLQAGNQPDSVLHWNTWVGFEGQRTNARIRNFDNNGGVRDSLRAAHDLSAISYFFFARVTADLYQRIVLEAALSYNIAAYEYTDLFPPGDVPVRRDFEPQWMPKFAASWLVADGFVVRASVAKGFSAPTLAEIRSSDNRINTTLQPEYGWNYEAGTRLEDRGGIMRWDLSAFWYRLDHAIVRKLNEAGEEYFENAGSVVQPGIESQLSVFVLRDGSGWFSNIVLMNSYTWNAFTFEKYTVDTIDYSGNRLTGTPEHVVVTSVKAEMRFGFSAFVQHYYVSSLPLNDANSEWADPYHLLQASVTWKYDLEVMMLHVFAGGDNLLNVKYSAGHDLNAAGGRYYNAAPPMNFYGGVSVTF
jgi:iron complex outermembrane recepter protein